MEGRASALAGGNPHLEARVLLTQRRQARAAAVQCGILGAQRLCLLYQLVQLGLPLLEVLGRGEVGQGRGGTCRGAALVPLALQAHW